MRDMGKCPGFERQHLNAILAIHCPGCSSHEGRGLSDTDRYIVEGVREALRWPGDDFRQRAEALIEVFDRLTARSRER